MADKRLLYFMSGQLHAYSWRAGRLQADAVFRSDEQGSADFSAYVAAAPRALYDFLADVVEEDFHFESIPYVRGRDRRTLLGRKLAQRYRDVSLATSVSLGYESGARREERMLYMSFTDTQQFQPWLTALQTREARLAGVYSLALVAPVLGRRLKIASTRYLMVSLQQAGLRQSYIEEGRIRFSRLGRMSEEDPEQTAQASARETARIQQYLVSMRTLPRDGSPLDVYVLAPARHMDLYRQHCVSNAQLKFHLLDLDASCAQAGLKSAPDGMLAERLYLHVLAGSRPAAQLAGDMYRRFYDVWRARNVVLGTGAAALALCLVFAGVRWLDVMSMNRLAEADRQAERNLAGQYARLQARYPKTPTGPDNLKGLVKNYQVVLKRDAPPQRLFVHLSAALVNSPQIELERVQWQVGADPKRAAGAGTVKGPPPPASAPGAKPAPGATYEVVQIDARVNVPQAGDYKNITLLVNEFVSGLKRQPGLEVIQTKLPFDVDAEKSVSGDIGAARPSQVPRFSVVVARRLGAG